MAMLGYSKLVIASYILDILVLIAFGFIAFGFSKVPPNYHPFSILDLSISYPNRPDTVTDTVLDVVSIAVPAAVIVLVALIFIRLPPYRLTSSWRSSLGLRGWELVVGWLGLALCHTTQIMIVTGLKNVIGKPRPDMLARCMPDVANLERYVVGGYGESVARGWVLVDAAICTQTDRGVLDDGFRSFPSGHSSTSFAGLLYLSLWFASKFAITIPFFPSRRSSSSTSQHAANSTNYMAKIRQTERAEHFIAYRDEAAAAPLWLVCLAYVPIGGAIYISASRYFDYRHHGFDILSGAFIGIVVAILAFRFYQVPLGRGAGYAWGPRSRARAFGVGVGRHGWVEDVDGIEGDEVRGSDEMRGSEGGSMNRMLSGSNV